MAYSANQDFVIRRQETVLPVTKRSVFPDTGTLTNENGQGATSIQTRIGLDLWFLSKERMPQYSLGCEEVCKNELHRINKIGNEFKRMRTLAVRSLLRCALSDCVSNDIDPAEWRFSDNAYGKPAVCSSQSDISFNISHTDAFSCLALSNTAQIGIDVEQIDVSRLKHMPDQCFTDYEKTLMRAQTGDRLARDFFRLWTLKEAYTKALGYGVSLAFDSIEFGLEPTVLRHTADTGYSAGEEAFDMLEIGWQGKDYLISICTIGSGAYKSGISIDNVYFVE